MPDRNMKNILVLGAGRTVPSLIDYLINQTTEFDFIVRLADVSESQAREKSEGYSNVQAVRFDVKDSEQLRNEISQSDLVISLLPVRFHVEVAKVCLTSRKDLLTASYVSSEMKALNEDAEDKGILFLNECGLDPGIDHMTAMAALDHIRLEQGGLVKSFMSYTGGLVAPDSDNNPWHYKFTWNPRNVVLAGTETAQFIRNGRYKYIPYHRLFSRLTEVEIDGYGDFEAYANRDSLKYRELYGLQEIETMIRGTLRRPGFCQAWNVLVQLGLTDDSYKLGDLGRMTYRDFVNTFLYYHPTKSVEDKLSDYLNIDPANEIMDKLKWLGLFDHTSIGLEQESPAAVLQHLLEKKWKLDPDDKDMIVMQHQIGYELNGKSQNLTTSLVVLGEDQRFTAMSKTVGWPLAIAARLILSGKLVDKGVRVPVTAQYYKPILNELRRMGVDIIEKQV